jgi:hypothetical protein
MSLDPEEVLKGMSRNQKKELFTTLAASLFENFSETEKKKLLQKIISGRVPGSEVIGMVEH